MECEYFELHIRTYLGWYVWWTAFETDSVNSDDAWRVQVNQLPLSTFESDECSDEMTWDVCEIWIQIGKGEMKMRMTVLHGSWFLSLTHTHLTPLSLYWLTHSIHHSLPPSLPPSPTQSISLPLSPSVCHSVHQSITRSLMYLLTASLSHSPVLTRLRVLMSPCTTPLECRCSTHFTSCVKMCFTSSMFWCEKRRIEEEVKGGEKRKGRRVRYGREWANKWGWLEEKRREG